MKHFKLLSMLLAATSLLLASCSIDNLGSNEINDGEECLVSFAIQIPGDMNAKTRYNTGSAPVPEEPEAPEEEDVPAWTPDEGEEPEDPDTPTVPVVDPFVPGGGTMVKKLSYFVYKATEYDYEDGWNCTFVPTEISGTIDLPEDLKASLDITLVKGVVYRIAFWADAFGFEEGSPYSIDTQTAKLSIDFDKIESNREDLDAFWGFIDIVRPSAGKQHSITLRRPFAQLNIGADLTKVEQLAVSKNSIATGIEVRCANAASLIGQWYDDVSYEDMAVRTFKLSPCPTNYIFPVEPETYDYLCMNYILVPYHEFEEDSVVPVKFNYTADNGEVQSRTINVPVERNHRTNIYGDLLTASSRVNVTVNPMFDDYDDDHNYEYEPGLTPLHDAAEKGGTVVLDEDYDLYETVVVKNNLVVDLNNHTISKTATGQGINAVFKVNEGGSLTIKGYGHVKALGENPENNYAVCLAPYSYSYAHLNIYGGSFEGNVNVLYESNLSRCIGTITGGGFTNKNNNNLINHLLANGLKLVTIENWDRDWDCVVDEEIDESGISMAWIEDLGDFIHALAEKDPDAGRGPRYLYSHRGVTYEVYDRDMTIYASEEGTIIDLGEQPFYESYGPKKVTIGEGIIDISDKTFYASGVTEVTLPSTLESISDYAFGFTNLRSVNIPENLTYIGDGAFRGADFETINLHNGIKYINREVFRETKLREIEFPDSTRYFGTECLAGCYNLEKITIKSKAFYIEDDSMLKEIYSWEPMPAISIYVDSSMKSYVEEVFSNFDYVSVWAIPTPPVSPTEPVEPTE